jgi:hypothetical protein
LEIILEKDETKGIQKFGKEIGTINEAFY